MLVEDIVYVRIFKRSLSNVVIKIQGRGFIENITNIFDLFRIK